MITWLLACAGGGSDTAGLAEGPVLSHQVPTIELVEGDDVVLSASAEDPDGVAQVLVYHRTVGSSYWQALELTQVDGSADGSWAGTVEDLQAPGLEYFLRGLDDGDPPATSYLPAGGEDAPLSLVVAVDALALPYSEGFEEISADDLGDLDWWTPSLGFTGGGFRLSSSHAHDGERSAEHLRGTATAGELDDWLVSPGLDLSTVDRPMVAWWQRGAAVERAEHELWLSTGDRDPAAGDFVLVDAVVEPPDGSWGQTAVDLSAWSGQTLAYLAWRTVGTEADDWWVDDVEVGALAPLLTEAELAWDPNPVAPGQTAVVTVTVRNAIDVDATGVSASLLLPEGGGSLAEDDVDVGTVAGLGEASASFSLLVDSGWPEHSYLPLTATFTDGDQDWVFDLDLVVGLPSTATVTLSTDQAGTVAFDLGVGDPDAAMLEIEAASGWYEPGTHLLAVDLTPYGSWLPPAAGLDSRWFGRVTASSDGTIDAFTIEHAGVLHEATYTPQIDAGLPATAQVPSPAQPELSSVEPDAVAPGDSDVALTLGVTNAGAETAGPVTVSLTSDDPDATVGDGGPYALTDDPWTRYDARTLTGPTLSVSDAHLDSSPVQLRLTFDDGVDSWIVPVSVEVPWPVPRLVSVSVDDDSADTGVDGDGDGILDAGEAVALTLGVGNGGTADTPAEVTATLSVTAGDATVTGDDVSLGVLVAGGTVDATWGLSVGEVEAVSLELGLSDGRSTWQLPVELTLGEAPWITLSASDDAVGDPLDDYAFDLVNARWRRLGDSLSLELSSAVDFDLDAVFIEAWGKSSGAPYAYYRWIVQPGATSLEGYVSGSGFTHIGSLDAVALDARTLLLSWSLADMELIGDGFSIGLAAGWCGPPDYYCDHLPDAWGYPYDSFSSGLWLPVEW